MTRTDLQDLAELRLREANALLASGNPCGAYYLAGFSIECALKACIARKTLEFDFPDKVLATKAFEHSPVKLIKVADLESDIALQLQSNPTFFDFWSIVTAWNVDRRYELNTTVGEAPKLINAIEDPANGVLKWLKNYW